MLVEIQNVAEQLKRGHQDWPDFVSQQRLQLLSLFPLTVRFCYTLEPTQLLCDSSLLPCPVFANSEHAWLCVC